MIRFTTLALLCALPLVLFAQEEKDEPVQGWEIGAGIGLDFAQLLQINPRQGAGQNRLGFGSATNSFFNFNRARINWETNALWQFGLQRLGSGVIAQGANDKIPFQKEIDDLRINSKYGVAIKEDSKFFYTGNLLFQTQALPTYQYDNDTYPGNFVSDWRGRGVAPISKLFAPATINVALGVDYKPNKRLSIFYSPLGGKFIVVANDSIAARGVHGNEVSGEPVNGFYPEFDNIDAQLGSQVLIKFAAPFQKDKGAFNSTLGLYSNYLDSPQNVDVDWNNSLSYTLIKNLKLTALLSVFYDDDLNVQVTNYDFPNGVNGLGKRVSLTQQLLLSYVATF
ncbi:DUF3078 domain-containing protein [Neolewinella antarctica]|uniref:DUF3078 domain-containing protein n=1 Tax=Neolewinella antarctica TaxID=442734 RepID=A0ABX0XAI8_9BACT|nr:DUF3078 domain-containing protein [Neolewinella antarctica]NJC25969.1 hypothetical protein [Neolewinella antarctica]